VYFGASKSFSSSAGLTSATMIGSPEYIAPEQLEGSAVFASDLYSLGVTCAYLLTQTSPFNLRHGNDWVWRQHLPRPVSASLGRIIDKMLSLSVQNRYGSAEGILTDLRQPPPASWQCVATLTDAAGRVRSVALSPDGQKLAGGVEDSSVKIWNLGTGNPPVVLSSLLKGHAGWVNALAFTPDGQLLVSGSGDRTIKIWNLGLGSLVRTLGGRFAQDFGWVYSLAVSPQGEWVAGGYGDKTVKIWNLATGKLLRTRSGAHSLGGVGGD
jgi:WD40 repeat protein